MIILPNSRLSAEDEKRLKDLKPKINEFLQTEDKNIHVIFTYSREIDEFYFICYVNSVVLDKDLQELYTIVSEWHSKISNDEQLETLTALDYFLQSGKRKEIAEFHIKTFLELYEEAGKGLERWDEIYENLKRQELVSEQTNGSPVITLKNERRDRANEAQINAKNKKREYIKALIITSKDVNEADEILTSYGLKTTKEKIAFLLGMFDTDVISTGESDTMNYWTILSTIVERSEFVVE